MSDVECYLEALPDERRQRVQHFVRVIEDAAPGLPWCFSDYGGGLAGYGRYHYRYASGRAGEFFMVGVASRKRYLAMYSNAADGERYLVETYADRFPGCRIGKSCIEVTDKIDIDDEALADLTRQTVAFFRAAFEKPRTPRTMHIWE